MKVHNVRALLLSILLLSLSGCSGKFICNFAIRPSVQTFEKTRKMVEKRYAGITAWHDSLRNEAIFRDTTISGENGCLIHAVYAGKDSAEGSVLLIHGYCVNHMAMMHLARLYRDTFNFNVLLPDLQYHGQSEGACVNMGWKDRLDARRWLNVACNLWQSNLLLVHGVSMGAATTMMLSGEPCLPESVRGFVEDCGYSSVWDQFSYLRRRFLVSDRKLRQTSRYCQERYGWNFFDASAVRQLEKCELPMLFIHGEKDDFVPAEFARQCYDAKKHGYKELWIAPDTPKHALSYHDHPVEYTERLRGFIRRIQNDLD